MRFNNLIRLNKVQTYVPNMPGKIGDFSSYNQEMMNGLLLTDIDGVVCITQSTQC